ncbi:MAG: S49 family peptidase [Chloroflexi bacterium]|nr:S49 family peptidase [Chloroflexota bacterium]
MEQPQPQPSDALPASAGRRRFGGWRGAALIAALAGILAGVVALAVLYAGPVLGLGPGVGQGKASVGVISLPPFIITENTSRIIMRHLDYARQDDSIQAVVISLSSPGGGAAASEKLYLEVRKLREDKPVVIVMNGIAASGGYMMAMAGNHVYAQPSSLVGNIGVIVGGISTLPSPPSERTIGTGPYKLSGADRQQWFDMLNRLRNSFVGTMVEERGDRLRLSPEQVGDARLYVGVEAVEYGLADAIGSDAEAIVKAAELAGLSDYDVADVNLLVLRDTLRFLRSELPPTAVDGESPTLWTGEGWADGYGYPLSLLTESAPGETPPGFPAGGQRPTFYYYYPGEGWTEPQVNYSPSPYPLAIGNPDNNAEAGSLLRGNDE